MSLKNPIECPECNGTLEAWSDVELELRYDLSRTGAPSKKQLNNSFDSDGRCGFNCKKCDWAIHVNDIESKELLGVLASVFGSVDSMVFSSKIPRGK